MTHSTYEPIFTDSIKDVIGDEPILDQSDIDYDMSYYGGLSDDFVTGSMLVLNKTLTRKRGVISFTESNPSRGRAFSKLYAESQPALDSTYGSSAVNRISSLSYRLVPWSERISHTSYRTIQCHDSAERFYDSCPPDMSDILRIDGAYPWTRSDNLDWPSPYNNFQTGSLSGYIFFNYSTPPADQFGQYASNVSDNDWTWSFPFEGKYAYAKRLINSSKIDVGLAQIAVSVTTSSLLFEEIETKSKKSQVNYFFPILPGRMTDPGLNLNVNLLRPSYKTTGSDGERIQALSGGYGDILSKTTFSDDMTFSLLFPADVKLNNLVSHGYLSDYPSSPGDPGMSYSTSSMSQVDQVKTFYGFGDLNNVTFGRYTITPTKGKFASEAMRYFEGETPNGEPGATYSPTTSDNLLTKWITPASNPWTFRTSTGKYVDNSGLLGKPGAVYQRYSGSAGGAAGIYWRTGTGVLVSDTDVSFHGDLNSSVTPATSSAIVEVTSSLPWTLTYNRGIAATADCSLRVFFSGLPLIPSHLGNATGTKEMQLIECLTGSTGTPRNVMSQYISYTHGVGRDQSNDVEPVTGHPLVPGEYRIVFDFIQDTVGASSIAVLDNFGIIQYRSDAFTPDQSSRIGSTNYPKFRTYVSDSRNAPIKHSDTTYEQLLEASSSYGSILYGISPQIRGWKYGLESGLPTHTKAIFRRNHFGHPRDMLEQRRYGKFVYVNASYESQEVFSTSVAGVDVLKTDIDGSLGSSPISVSFIRQRYTKDDRGIGYIYAESVSPYATVSQNLSTESTSSVPYFDGEAVVRPESTYTTIS